VDVGPIFCVIARGSFSVSDSVSLLSPSLSSLTIGRGSEGCSVSAAILPRDSTLFVFGYGSVQGLVRYRRRTTDNNHGQVPLAGIQFIFCEINQASASHQPV